MPPVRSVGFPSDVLKGLLAYAAHMHPREIFLLLRGEQADDMLIVKEFILPPLTTHGVGFTSFPLWLLPSDPSIIGSVHSHPSGSLTPSSEDLNHFYGRIMVIVAFPYRRLEHVAAYGKNGEKLPVKTL